MGTTQLTIGHPSLIGFEINSAYWIFATDEFKPSYWLILKREGFSGDVLQASDELDDVTWELNEQQLLDIYRLESYETPWYFFTDGLRTDLETVILSGRIQVFKVDEQTAQRLADRYDPIYSNPTIHDTTGHSVVDIRNRLAEELGKDIVTRWIGKDKSDQLHWDRWGLWRETVEAYDVGAEVVDTVVDLVVGLWDIVKFVVTIVGDTIELAIDVAGAAAAFQRKLLTGDIDAIKQDLENMGIAVGNALDSAEVLIAKAREGLTVFNRLKDDPASRQLIIDYFDSLYQTIKYRASRTIGVRIVSEVGIEVLLAMATGGAGNVARRAGQTGAKGSKVAKAANATKRIGPFTTKAIDDMVDLAKALDKPAVKTEKSPITVIPEDLPSKKKDGPDRDNKLPKSSKKYSPKSLDDAQNRLAQRRKQIATQGYQAKYSDTELTQMAKTGEVGNERFQVRFMESSYLNDRKTPNTPLSGKMGGPFEGDSGKGVKYWSTSFDQLEDADSDPKLISEKVGIKYDPEKEYALVIVDNQKAADLSGTRAITPTFKDLGNFAKEELPDQFDAATIDKVYTSKYQEKYNSLYNEANDLGIDIWDDDGMRDFQAIKNMNNDEINLFESRLGLHGKLGSNEDFLGNGLTKSLIENDSNKYGVVETFTFERTPQNLATLKENGAINIIDNLSPIGK